MHVTPIYKLNINKFIITMQDHKFSDTELGSSLIMILLYSMCNKHFNNIVYNMNYQLYDFRDYVFHLPHTDDVLYA